MTHNASPLYGRVDMSRREI